MGARRRDYAFTLVELLVVIGIISVLMGLLLPVVAQARRAAGAAQCASNLRQWAVAVNLYAGQWHGFLPRRGQGQMPTTLINRPEDWFNALPPIMKMKAYVDLAPGNIPRPGAGSLWICPQSPDVQTGNYFGYAMNMWLSTWLSTQPDRIDKVGSPATMVFMADGPGAYSSVMPFPGSFNPDTRHNGRTNLAFLDGHVAAYLGNEIGYNVGDPQRADVRWKPPNSVWTGLDEINVSRRLFEEMKNA